MHIDFGIVCHPPSAPIGKRVQRGVGRCRWSTALVLRAVAGMLLLPAAAFAQPPPNPPDQRQLTETTGTSSGPEPVEHVKVEGFRSARGGRDAAQVKAAIHKDFGFPA